MTECTGVGLQGSVAQNRAVEGDIVALQILPPSSWFISSALVKSAGADGSALHPSHSTPAALTAAALDLPEPGSQCGQAGSAERSGADRQATSAVPCVELPSTPEPQSAAPDEAAGVPMNPEPSVLSTPATYERLIYYVMLAHTSLIIEPASVHKLSC